MARRVVRDERLVVGPEAQVLGREDGGARGQPLPLGRERVVLGPDAVGHRRVPVRLRAPAPAVALVVFVVVGHPGPGVPERLGRDLEVAVTARVVVQQGPVDRQRRRPDVVEGAVEPDLVLDDRAADREVALPVLLGLAGQPVAGQVEQPVVGSGQGDVGVPDLGDRVVLFEEPAPELRIVGHVAVELRCCRTGSGRRWPRRRSSRIRPWSPARRRGPPRRRCS